MPTGESLLQVEAGHNFSAALKTDGTVEAWGDNNTNEIQKQQPQSPDSQNKHRPNEKTKHFTSSKSNSAGSPPIRFRSQE